MFSVLSINRKESRWEEHLAGLTPWESHGGVWFKREDKFAPLGYGGINGSKLRQLIWLFNRSREGKRTVVSGASVKSPQLSMTSVVAHHFGLQTELTIGATKPHTAIKHPNVQIAARFGAKFSIIKVGYNPALQRAVHDSVRPGAFPIEYGITLDKINPTPEELLAFHRVGAAQVQNIPDSVSRLIIPAGSCNTLVSVLLGIAMYRPYFLGSIFTVGIGPSKMLWVHKRLGLLEEASGLDIRKLFCRAWSQHEKEAAAFNYGDAPILWEHFNIQTSGFSTYHQSMRETFAGIEMHPTYEGKIFRWLKRLEIPELDKADETIGFWLVGSEPKIEILEKFAPLPEQEEVTLL